LTKLKERKEREENDKAMLDKKRKPNGATRRMSTLRGARTNRSRKSFVHLNALEFSHAVVHANASGFKK